MFSVCVKRALAITENTLDQLKVEESLLGIGIKCCRKFLLAHYPNYYFMIFWTELISKDLLDVLSDCRVLLLYDVVIYYFDILFELVFCNFIWMWFPPLFFCVSFCL